MVAARLTFFGACREAVDFYCKVFRGKVTKKSYFCDNLSQFPMGLSEEAENLLYSACLQIPDAKENSYICMGDSPVLAFSGSQEMQGCKDNVVFDVELSSVTEVERIYHEFVNDGAKLNIALCTKDNYRSYASFIDRFGVCWNVYCEKEGNYSDKG